MRIGDLSTHLCDSATYLCHSEAIPAMRTGGPSAQVLSSTRNSYWRLGVQYVEKGAGTPPILLVFRGGTWLLLCLIFFGGAVYNDKE